MAGNVKMLIAKMLRMHKQHVRYVAVVSCIALLVASGVELGLRRIGITLTHEETVLDCHYDGNGAHTHTSDCYDESGNLVCPLPERELHVHDDSCFTVETHLVCGQEESEDHVHTDACYETTRSLTCDKEEVTEEHVHGPSCFKTITVPGSAPTATPDPSVTPAQTFTDELKDPDNNDKVILQVHVEAPEGAFPEGTAMHIEPVDAQDIQDAVDEALAKKTDAKVMDIQAVDITFHDGDDNEIEPAKEITVVLTSDLIKDNDDPLIVHVDDKGKADVVETLNDRQIVEHDLTPEEDKLVFASNKFSTYGIVITSLHGTLTSGDNNTYDINVEVPAAAGIPQGAELEVVELEGAAYDEYLSRAAEALGLETVAYARVFDISIVNGEGAKVQPSAPVAVSIELLDADATAADFSVVHFPDETSETNAPSETNALSAPKPPDTMSAHTDGNTVSFDTTGFSAYAIVQGPGDVPLGWTQIKTLNELRDNADTGLYIGTTSGFYMTNTTAVGSRDANTTGIVKTTPTQSFPPESTASLYYLEPADTDTTFYIYCLDSGGNKQYVYNNGDANLTFTADPTTAFNVTIEANTGRIRFNNGARYWNMWNGTNGNHIAAYNVANDGGNYFYVWLKEDYSGDPYGLDGLAYGLMNWNGGTAGKALMSTSSTTNCLDALALTVMSKTGSTDDMDKLFVPDDSDISQWTFEWIEGDLYYLKTTVDDSPRYLQITSSGLALVETPNNNCRIQVIPGTGTHAGEISLKANGNTLTYTGDINTGFKSRGSAGTEWLKLVEVSEITSDHFLPYSATKVSVSDPTVTNGSHIVVYTRVWNEQKLRYDFYGVDHDGSLVPCYESGDEIQWVGPRLNTMLWDFVEYYWEGTDDPNFYYELYNQYSEQYIAPQVSDGQILSDDIIGINLNGRRNGQYQTPIVAWDDENYSYVGLKADVASGKVVSCPASEADDFYFAILQDRVVDDAVHTVDTIDNNKYGITMRMVDFTRQNTGASSDNNVRLFMSNFLGSNAGGAVDTTVPNLLSTNLDESGYPTTSAGNSLADWFSSTYGVQDVNHLFIQSTYDASGYFEYDSAQNFASLDSTTHDFKVYKEIATVNSNGAHYQHGQFFPFNDIKAGTFASTSPKNLTTAGGSTLPDSDPRKGEQLYLVQGTANYYNALEVSATFMQTPSGKDDWGHDIIYEFTGDDDFWLYVDGELIVDLGGIHNALSGSVNYRTGEVIVNGVHHTLRELFESNYKKRNPDASPEDVAEYLSQYFDEGETVFKDYTNHTMKIFYLERGAGASNLHMRFNLASVKPGTVLLTKNLEGVDNTETVTAEFPYQIKYKLKDDPTEYYLSNAHGGQPVDYVYYKDTTHATTYLPSLEIDGVTYNDVFMLNPKETVEISFPAIAGDIDSVESYSIVECGVDTNVYESVSANGEEIEGTTRGTHREDYALDYTSTADRSRVIFTNQVNPDALRTINITKHLFKEDGVTEIDADTDDTTFTYRLYMGTEFDDELPVANMHTYHVKDPDGNYCRWDTTEKKLVPLGEGMNDYASLTPEEKASVSFTTSINGSITRVPTGYTVEVRNVLAGTQFRVVERPNEMPDGYSFQKYVYEEDEYRDAEEGVADTIKSEDDHDPQVDVCNLKGWGLRVNKVWTDADYMTEREATYFAVFTGEDEDNLTLVPGTVRQLPYDTKTLYWYFLPLPVQVPFDQYWLREVTIENANPTVDADGVVSDPGTVTPIADEGSLTLNGKQKGEEETAPFEYTVLYERSELEEDSNVRLETVTNNRPGVELRKTTWDGETPLPRAKFTLTDQEGEIIGTFTSGEDGLITVAFLRDDVTYTLTEDETPHTYHGLEAPMTIVLSNGAVTVDGVDSEYYAVDPGDGGTPAITVKNRPYTLQTIKRDADSEEPMEGVEFALHKQHSVDGATSIDPNPMVGYENLVTDADGVVPRIDTTLAPGTYQLREMSTLAGYDPLPSHTMITVSDTGAVTLGTHPEDNVELTCTPESDGSLSYVLTIDNVRRRDVSFKKVDVTAPESSALAGAEFDLYKVVDGERQTPALFSELVSGDDGMVALGGQKVFSLPLGTYHLVETKAPAGYNKMAPEVVIYVTADGVTYDDGTSYSSGREGVSYDGVTKVYTLKICNSPGTELPYTGGPGTALYTVFGTALIVAGLAYGLSNLKGRAHAR